MTQGASEPNQPPIEPSSAWATGQGSEATTGCLKMGLGVGALLVIGLIVALIVGAIVLMNVFGSWIGDNGDLGDIDQPCPYLTNVEAAEALGGNPEARLLTPLYEVTIGAVLDRRVLDDGQRCWVFDEGGGNQSALISRYEGGDAAAKFAAEREESLPQREDMGGGVDVTREGWFHRDVDGVGDGAFCTTAGFEGAVGALVRRGNRLVYASIHPGGWDLDRYTIEPEEGYLVSESLCEEARDLALRIAG